MILIPRVAAPMRSCVGERTKRCGCRGEREGIRRWLGRRGAVEDGDCEGGGEFVAVDAG